jgi:hypothetical protein
MADYMTRAEIVTAVEGAIKVPRGSKETFVQNLIEQVYNEILVCDPLHPLFWLVKFDDSVRSIAPMTITGISQASPGVVTAANTLSNGDIVTLYNVGGMTELEGRTAVVANASSADFELTDMEGTDIDTSGFTTFTTGGTVHHRGAALSTNVRRILGAKWIGETIEGMEPILPDDLEKTTHWEDTTGEPHHYLHQKKFTTSGTETNRMLWFCAPDAIYRLRYWYEYRPPALTDSTVPMLPPRFHRVISAGVIARAAESSAQVENAVIWPGLYMSGLDQIRDYNREYWTRNTKYDAPYMI